MLTSERLKEIERALAATTPGEWHTSGVPSWTPWVASDDTVAGNMVCTPPEEYCDESLEYWGANADFIIAAHNSYIPELLAEVRWLREQRSYQEGWEEGWNRAWAEAAWEQEVYGRKDVERNVDVVNSSPKTPRP